MLISLVPAVLIPSTDRRGLELTQSSGTITTEGLLCFAPNLLCLARAKYEQNIDILEDAHPEFSSLPGYPPISTQTL